MSELVTGEAVMLEMRLAKLASRSLALAIDIAVQLVLLLVGVLVLSGTVSFVDEALGAALGLVFFVAVIVGYPVAFETLTRGRSLGKMALGLRVVREDGGPVRFRQSFVRALIGVVEIWLTFGSVALIASLASSQGKRLGDYLGRHRRGARAGAGAGRADGRDAAAAGRLGRRAGPVPGARTTWRWPPGSSWPGRTSCRRRCATRWARSLAGALARVTAPPPPPGRAGVGVPVGGARRAPAPRADPAGRAGRPGVRRRTAPSPDVRRHRRPPRRRRHRRRRRTAAAPPPPAPPPAAPAAAGRPDRSPRRREPVT